MKRLFFLIAILALLLTACGEEAPENTSLPSFQASAPESTGTSGPTEPETTDPTGPAEPCLYVEVTLSDDYTMGDLCDELSERVATGELERYTLRVNGLSTPVTMTMDGLDVLTLQAYETELEVECYATQGCMNISLGEYDGILLVNETCDYRPRAWIITETSCFPFLPEQGVETWFRVAEDGIRYQSCIHDYMTTFEQDTFSPITSMLSRAAFVYEEGRLDMDTGIPERMPLAVYGLDQVYDLDELFREGKEYGLFSDYDTVDQFFAAQQGRTPETDDVTWVFDERGVLIRQNRSTSPLVYQFDDDGEIQRVQRINILGKTTQEMIFRDGKLETSCTYDGAMVKYRHTYDRDGYLVSEECILDQQTDYIHTFDRHRRRIMEERFLDGAQIWRSTFDYEEDGEVRSYVSEVFDPQGRLSKKIFLEGGYVDMWSFYDGIEQYCYSYSYDETGALIGEVREEPPHGVKDFQRKFYFYDQRGLLVAAYTAEQGQVYIAFYDELGRITDRASSFGPESDGCNFEYREDGSYIKYYVGATYGSSITEYDPQGRVIRHDCYGDEDLEEGYTYRYDARGDLVWMEVRSDYHDTQIIEYTYEYDAQGNWIKQTVWQSGEVTEVVEREYDQSGKLLRDGDTVYTYDHRGLLIDDGECTYTYDDQGRMTGKQCGSHKTSFYYDDQGRLVEEVSYYEGETE